MAAAASAESDASKAVSNSRGIPTATFLEDVPAYVAQHYSATPEGAEAVLKELHELYGKYKFMEGRLVNQKRGIVNKIPEIESALSAINHIAENEEKNLNTRFELADSLYVKAKIVKTGKVNLWLGANVMVEYDIDEAKALLEKNLKNAKSTLEQLDKDLAFLKDQITTSEVNIARTHNYKVTLNNALKEKEKGKPAK